jgi:CorA-like Mg2+ transporter protein
MAAEEMDDLSNTSGWSFNFVDNNELEYMGLIQNKIQLLFPNFAAALSRQSSVEREIGRCAVVEFNQGFAQRTSSFGNSVELRHYLLATSRSPAFRSKNEPKRRLFILEDLPRNYILTLGSRLRIPPSFFAGHYDDPASSTFNHRNPFERHTKSQFRLRYANSHRAEVDVPSHKGSGIYAFNTNVCRYLHAYDPKGPLYDEMRSHHILSFWSSPLRVDGSWDAVLLVDPPLTGYVKCLPSMQLAPVRRKLQDESSIPKHYLYPEMNRLQELPEEVSEWVSAYECPQYISMFDDALNEFASGNQGISEIDNPMAMVKFPRKLVIGIMLAFLRRRYLNLLRIQKTHVKPNQNLRNNYLSSFSEGALSSWHDEFFDFIVGSCAAMKELIWEMEENMVSLGLPIKNRPTWNSGVVGGLPQWEIDGWRSVLDLSHVVDRLTNALATGYLQYITIQEARISNGNAQSLSKITVLTMLFIPLSTIAGIFSMSGDFLPGNPRAWVFWVVSIPVLMMLAYLYWRQELVEAMMRKRQSLLLLLEPRERKATFPAA